MWAAIFGRVEHESHSDFDYYKKLSEFKNTVDTHTETIRQHDKNIGNRLDDKLNKIWEELSGD